MNAIFVCGFLCGVFLAFGFGFYLHLALGTGSALSIGNLFFVSALGWFGLMGSVSYRRGRAGALARGIESGVCKAAVGSWCIYVG